MRSLAEFTRWFLAQPLGTLPVPQVPLAYITDPESTVTITVLYREAPYQVELFCFHPSPKGCRVSEHRHPDVDSVEFFLSGDITFTINGIVVNVGEYSHVHSLAGARLSVRRKDWHGATIGPGGAAFLSMQKWRVVPITSVSHNWEGPPHLSHSDL